jgi:hypothetical protein
VCFGEAIAIKTRAAMAEKDIQSFFIATGRFFGLVYFCRSEPKCIEPPDQNVSSLVRTGKELSKYFPAILV